MRSWRRPLLLAAAVLTALHGDAMASGYCDTDTGNLQNNYPLPQPSEARYLLPEETASDGIQVIVPGMAFGCSGRITAWSGHTLVLTKPNFVEILTHRIALQVWRPIQGTPDRFSLVGSNDLTFANPELQDGITEIQGTNQTAFFSFENKTVSEDEQIYFRAGDVIGWYVYPIQGSIDPPLSPLYRAPFRNDLVGTVVDLLVYQRTAKNCVQCSENGRQMVEGVVPMLSVTFKVGQQQACSSSCNGDTFMTPTTAGTTPITPSSSGSTDKSTSASRDTSLSASDITCIVIAVITLVLHAILILLCSLNCYVLKEIRSKLHSTAAKPQSPSTMQLAYKDRRMISNETPANYGPSAPPLDYERAQDSTSPYEMVDGQSRSNLLTSKKHGVQALKGTESPALSTRSDFSRDGSRLDLLKI